MLNQFYEFLNFAKQQNQQGHQTVMATIVETQGSSYQKAGARMLISESGEFNGILAGGCFEGDLIEQSQDVFASGNAKEVYYDMRSSDDVIWGLGLGCDGAVRILLQRLSADDDFEPLASLAFAAQQKQTVLLASVINSESEQPPSGLTFLWPDDERLETDDVLIQEMNEISSTEDLKRPVYKEIDIEEKTVSIFIQKILPPRQLLLLGAGPDAVPLAQMAAQLRWHVTVADHRPANLDTSRFPESVSLTEVTPESILTDLNMVHFDSMVLMTHSYDYDLRYLKSLAKTNIPYIGLLGPAHRRDRLYSDLGELAQKIEHRSHGPIGVDIGSKTPEEIALSILAELQAVYAGKEGGLLDSRAIN